MHGLATCLKLFLGRVKLVIIVNPEKITWEIFLEFTIPNKIGPCMQLHPIMKSSSGPI